MEPSPPSQATRPAGYAAIALASAAGVIAASRMSRPGLVLAASLALAWWKKHQQSRTPPAPQQQPEEISPSTPPVPVMADAPEMMAPTMPPAPPPTPFEPTPIPDIAVQNVQEAPPAPDFQTEPAPLSPPAPTPLPEIVIFEEPPPPPTVILTQASLPPPTVEEATEPEAPAVVLPPAPPMAFPIAPLRTEEPLSEAWNDLRAALNPSLAKPPTQPLAPIPPAFEEPSPPEPLPQIQAPEMPEMYVFPPSSPLLDMLDEDEPLPDSASLHESEPLHFIPQPPAEPVGEIPDEICLPGLPDEESVAGMEAPSFLVTDPPVADPTPPMLVRSPLPPVIFPQMEAPPAPSAESDEPPVTPTVEPREVQAKKSFFDWLRS